MLDETSKEKELNSKIDKKEKPVETDAAPKKKKIAVVFHSQNSVNHKNHPMSKGTGTGAAQAQTAAPKKTATKTTAKPAAQPEKKTGAGSPNGRPLPPGTARVTPLKELNAIEKKRAEQEAKEEAARKQAAAAAAEQKRQQEAAAAAQAAAERQKAQEAAEARARESKPASERPSFASRNFADRTPRPAGAGSGNGYRGNNNGTGNGYRGNSNGTGTGYRGNGTGTGTGTGYRGNGTGSGTGYRGNGTGTGTGYRGNGTGSGTGYRGNGTGTGTGYRGNGTGTGTGYRGNGTGTGTGYRGNGAGGTGTGYRGNGAGGAGNGYRGNGAGQGRPMGGGAPRRRDEAPVADVLVTKPTGHVNNTKPTKSYQNKNYDSQKASISQKNRDSRKQNKYGAAQSYARDEQVVHKKKNQKGAFIKPDPIVAAPVEEIKSIALGEVTTIKELSDKMKKKASDIIKMLFLKGQIVTLNTELSYEEAENIAVEYDILCEKEEKVDVIAELIQDTEEDPEDSLVSRPPVVCVMGHVDHGKTSILDAIRKTNVTSREHGGITQSIGAYQIQASVNGDPRTITFLDTPGHEAFTAMRMRGAQSTDIAVLVVAADDGIMPQTIEAINHAKSANTTIIVAVNKIDKPAANVDRIKQELMAYDLVPEEFGGSTVICPVSAKTGEGLQNLLEMIALTADVMDLKANPNRKAYGVVIEAELDKGRGSVARLLVQKGTLHVGDFIAAGACYGKVRAMIDDKGKQIKKAGPSTPVEILGLNAVPNAGEIVQAQANDKDAKAYAATFIAENKQKMVESSKKKVSLDALFDQIKAGDVKELPIVVKADVQGSVEAVKDSLEKIRNEEVAVKVIHSGVGAINESDVVLASAANAIVIGFDVKPDTTAREIADRENVDIRLYNIIYKAIEDVENAMKGMLAPVFEEKVIGHVIVRQIFKSSDVGAIAGSYVTDGMVQRGAKCRITRGNEQVFEGDIESVKRFKDDVKEVKSNYECGLVFAGYSDMQVDDQIEVYVMEEVKR